MIKYPSTTYWSEDFTNFVGKEVVITEKLDGGNTCLYKGEVYARSVSSPSHHGWMAMVRKHHAHKISIKEDTMFYGEDLYGVHSIEYDPLKEDSTFYLFALRTGNYFASWNMVEYIANHLSIPTVPVLFKGSFSNTKEITKFFEEQLKLPSELGSEAEGFVIRTVRGFNAKDFSKNVCKYVRPNHVQTDEHWRKNWQPCKIVRN
tara:strand:+ start:1504 stop:2115 length:612 start_codon:yes stop_codon:yes gene_type:complete